jgi:signal transduction histidine kinase
MLDGGDIRIRWTSRWWAIALILAANSAASFEAVHAYHAERNDAELQMKASGAAIASHMGSILRNTHLLLLDISDWLGTGSSMSDVDAARLRGRISALSFVDASGVLDADGRIVFSSQPPIGPSGALDSEHKTNKTLHISHPFLSSVSGKLIIPATIPSIASDGSFSAVIGVGIKPEYLSQFFINANGHASVTSALRMDDGTFLVRSDSSFSSYGQHLSYSEIIKNGVFTFHQEDTSEDGIARFVGVTPVPDYPLVVTTTISVSEAMESWRREIIESFGTSIAVSIGLFILALMADRREHARMLLAVELKLERDGLDDQVQARTKDLFSQVEVKNRMLGILAHDLRTPLGVISGRAELLEMIEGERLSEQTKLSLSSILEATTFMAELIKDTLESAVNDAGDVRLDREMIDISWIVKRAAAWASSAADDKNITLVVEAQPTKIEVDPLKLAQVLNNLIGNAVKFSNPGGQVRVSARPTEAGCIIQVSDQGVGISPEIRKNLFSPFCKGQKGTAGESSNGLGLYICSRIVTAHQGAIDADSVPGGTTFTISLPSHAQTI